MKKLISFAVVAVIAFVSLFLYRQSEQKKTSKSEVGVQDTEPQAKTHHGKSEEKTETQTAEGISPVIKEQIPKISKVRKGVKFSDKLLKWYPIIYEELDTDDVQKKFSVFQKLMEIKAKDREGATDDDMAGVIGELLSDGGNGLKFYQKRLICDISRGVGYSVSDTDDNGESYEIRGDWGNEVISAAHHIKKLLQDKDARVREAATLALWVLNATDAIPEIKELLNDENTEVRCEAVTALGKLNVKDVIPEITRLLSDGNIDIRRNAVEALGIMNATDAIPHIKPLLKDDDTIVRMNAVIALAQLKAKDMIPDIKELLKDNDEGVRGYVELALLKLGVSEGEIEKAKNVEED
ncbi:MAG: hypothetical protein A2W23_01060 [Planctomycetes bacterium RBG_16_43_13]|nr:MAG: hypothetical protein A2W23_01060 [Planctomycetes bacterium RBG_16_43_13]